MFIHLYKFKKNVFIQISVTIFTECLFVVKIKYKRFESSRLKKKSRKYTISIVTPFIYYVFQNGSGYFVRSIQVTGIPGCTDPPTMQIILTKPSNKILHINLQNTFSIFVTTLKIFKSKTFDTCLVYIYMYVCV